LEREGRMALRMVDAVLTKDEEHYDEDGDR
jgi:hypothetical protein